MGWLNWCPFANASNARAWWETTLAVIAFYENSCYRVQGTVTVMACDSCETGLRVFPPLILICLFCHEVNYFSSVFFVEQPLLPERV